MDIELYMEEYLVSVLLSEELTGNGTISSIFEKFLIPPFLGSKFSEYKSRGFASVFLRRPRELTCLGLRKHLPTPGGEISTGSVRYSNHLPRGSSFST